MLQKTPVNSETPLSKAQQWEKTKEQQNLLNTNGDMLTEQNLSSIIAAAIKVAINPFMSQLDVLERASMPPPQMCPIPHIPSKGGPRLNTGFNGQPKPSPKKTQMALHPPCWNHELMSHQYHRPMAHWNHGSVGKTATSLKSNAAAGRGRQPTLAVTQKAQPKHPPKSTSPHSLTHMQ
jgi:hypothetical protein